VTALLLAALVGVVHVHHAPSHDSEGRFREVVEAAAAAELDFVVLTEHVEGDEDAPLPASEHAGLHAAENGRRVLVLVGAEFGTSDGHLLGLEIPRAYASRGRGGRELIERIHADGGFAVVPHPFTHGGWRDFEAPFDGLEVHNNASDFRRLLGPAFPLRLLQATWDRPRVLRAMLVRPERELELWESVLEQGRRVVGFSGADAHQNTSLLGWQLDPYAQMFAAVRTVCPDGPLAARFVWTALRRGHCSLRYSLYEERASEAREVTFPSGRRELWLDDGRRVLEIGQPPPGYNRSQ
jgi:hypothetical protein